MPMSFGDSRGKGAGNTNGGLNMAGKYNARASTRSVVEYE